MNVMSQQLSKARPELAAMAQKMNEDEILERAIREGLKGVRRGGIMHRFRSDAAIYAYCLDNDLDAPIVNPDGGVTAWSYHQNNAIQIGWVC